MGHVGSNPTLSAIRLLQTLAGIRSIADETLVRGARVSNSTPDKALHDLANLEQL